MTFLRVWLILDCPVTAHSTYSVNYNSNERRNKTIWHLRWDFPSATRNKCSWKEVINAEKPPHRNQLRGSDCISSV